jgi:hypothetical protein
LFLFNKSAFNREKLFCSVQQKRMHAREPKESFWLIFQNQITNNYHKWMCSRRQRPWKYFDLYSRSFGIRRKLMEHLRQELIENLLFNKKPGCDGVFELLPGKIKQCAPNNTPTKSFHSFINFHYFRSSLHVWL